MLELIPANAAIQKGKKINCFVCVRFSFIIFCANAKNENEIREQSMNERDEGKKKKSENRKKPKAQ